MVIDYSNFVFYVYNINTGIVYRVMKTEKSDSTKCLKESEIMFSNIG